jgi:hypothetical protein
LGSGEGSVRAGQLKALLFSNALFYDKKHQLIETRNPADHSINKLPWEVALRAAAFKPQWICVDWIPPGPLCESKPSSW